MSGSSSTTRIFFNADKYLDYILSI